jgi:hypothetical protein
VIADMDFLSIDFLKAIGRLWGNLGAAAHDYHRRQKRSSG